MTRGETLAMLLKAAGNELNDAGRTVLAEFLDKGVHVSFEGTTAETVNDRIEQVCERGDGATVRDLRNVLRAFQERATARGADYGIVGIGVTYDPQQPDAEAAIMLVTGGRKTFQGHQVSPHYRMPGIVLAMRQLGAPHELGKNAKGIPTSVKFGVGGSLSAAPATETTTAKD